MDALRDEYLAKAQETLPKALTLARELERACADPAPITEEQYYAAFNAYNVYSITLCGCLHTQMLPQRESNGHHSELVVLLEKHLGIAAVPAYYSKLSGTLAEQARRSNLANIATWLLHVYVQWTLNFDDLIKAREKKKADLY
jgi:hypothetical protein